MIKEREIEAINVNLACSLECEACEKYFDCASPSRKAIYDRGRLKRVRENLRGVRKTLAIMSGKGGVGKSSLTAVLALGLAMKGYKVSVFDQDFDGPCIPRMLGAEGKRLTIDDEGINPVLGFHGIQVVSMGLVAREDEVVTWLHGLRRNATEEFLSHVKYGERDYLLIDMPPGTSSDCLNVLQCLPDIDGAVVVTVPTEVSQKVARKAALLCRKAGLRVLGVIENMSGHVCPGCGLEVNILQKGGGETLARELGIPFLGGIPLDARLSEGMDRSIPFLEHVPDSPTSRAILSIVEQIRAALER